MLSSNRLRDMNLWGALGIVLLTVYLSVATYLHWIQVTFRVGPYFFAHWLAWIGTLYIAFVTPVNYIMRRRNIKRVKVLRNIHMYGNLFAFILISIHFFQQVGRPPQFYPELGTGLTLYLVVLVLVATGFVQRFQISPRLGKYGGETASALPHYNRSIHVGTIIAFYLVIITHILHGIRLL